MERNIITCKKAGRDEEKRVKVNAGSTRGRRESSVVLMFIIHESSLHALCMHGLIIQHFQPK